MKPQKLLKPLKPPPEAPEQLHRSYRRLTKQRDDVSRSLGYEGQRYEVTAVEIESQERHVFGWTNDATGGGLRRWVELRSPSYVASSVHVRDLRPEGDERG